MPNTYYTVQKILLHSLFLSLSTTVWAQSPTITAVEPSANTRAAIRSATVKVTFNQPLSIGAVSALKVYSAQRGGLRTRGTTPAVVIDNTLQFHPTPYSFRPGELVQYTVTTAATSNTGNLNQARVGQFITNVGGNGTGNFTVGSTPSVAGNATKVVTGDVDGDGDLDLLTSNTDFSGAVSIRLNDGHGNFSGGSDVSLGGSLSSLILNDVDGDGDLDLLVSNGLNNTVSVRLNDGNGSFSGTQEVNAGTSPNNLIMGDVDGDGDLDLLVSNDDAYTVSIRLNNGSGVFSGSLSIPINTSISSLAIGDVENDGDLDLLAGTFDGKVRIKLNDGSGNFSGTQNIVVGDRGTYPASIAVGDIDGDGDLDFLAANIYGRNTVSVRLNNGSGIFSGTQEVDIQLTAGDNESPECIALGDVDADGDLDLFATHSSNLSRTVALRLNNGSGIFAGNQNVSVNYAPLSIVLADVDNDGDLDLLAANSRGNLSTVSVRLNNGTGVLSVNSANNADSFNVFPNPARTDITLIGAVANTPVVLFDMLGHILFTYKIYVAENTHLKLPASLSSGVYLLQSGAHTCRIIVE